MKKNINKQLIIAGLLISSCKSLNTNIQTNEQVIPKRYSKLQKTNDSANISDIVWKNFFNDQPLNTLIDEALTNNFDYKLALERIELLKANLIASKGKRIPQISANINGGVRKFGLYTMDGAGNITTEIIPGKIVPINLPDMYLGMQASWEADLWGKLKNQKKSALAQFRASSTYANLIKSNLIYDIAASYYELLALDNELDILNSTLTNHAKVIEAIKVQKEAGRVNELAVQQFKNFSINTTARKIEVEQQIVEFENQINFLLGRFPQPIKRSTIDVYDDIPNVIQTGIPSNLLNNRPDIKQAEYMLTASKFDLQSAKAAFYPSLNITAGFGFQAFNPSYLFKSPASQAFSLLGGLLYPLVNKTALKAQFATAKSNQLSAIYTYQKTILNAFTEVANELDNFENLRTLNELRAEQNNISKNTIEISNSLFFTGKATYLEVLYAQQGALASQLEYNTVKKLQKLSQVNLYKVLGGGWK